MRLSRRIPDASRLGMALLLVAAAPPVARAHPGHGWTDASWGHVLSSPDHLGLLLLAGLAAALTGRCLHCKAARRALEITGGGLVLAALVGFGLGL